MVWFKFDKHKQEEEMKRALDILYTKEICSWSYWWPWERFLEQREFGHNNIKEFS